ncbi:type 2 isopentenyl-diphosphate Delta-isomerase [Tissierella sp. Yu-01]|uniref:type 2 isopentenyl-diphosphate Delta-isomerase n=1 Tax=Tissierella sp. Yu-01 TaxID=3035694 RepID=UPI00240E7712|nr:type 2 isopentenyl-diphosphate Delta-isomerase [Tissierella sp. Yu-01]WFA08116.1 type 2 isopentenyl-diphosphate Delta-isomerase [Tissierella sp. Yu-01]
MRSIRKKEHIENYLKTTFQGDTLLGDVFLEHNALPNLNLNEIDTSTTFLGKKISFPILINAMTGGSSLTQEINRDLSMLAKEFNIPMAVGSQTIALEDAEGARESFKIVREIIGNDGVVISNLSGQATADEAKQALELVDGDAIQIHLNTAQELVMEEGDREFRGVIDNIQSIVQRTNKPVIVKEVGFGISKNVAERLYNIGIRYVDVAGFGGTNFVEIENLRNHAYDYTELYSWGIPTAAALVNCRKLPKDLKLISSGGIRNSTDVVKSIVLGAEVAGISGELLSYLVHGGYSYAKEYLDSLVYKIKILMLLLGKKNIEELRNSEYKVTGKLKDLV